MFGAGSKIFIKRIIIIRAGTYEDMTRRSYIANATADNIEAFRQVTRDGSTVTPQSVAGVAGQLIQPEGSPSGLAFIENGWGEYRARFMMEVESTSPMGSVVCQLISGYTDYVGYTASGSIDPQMKMYFNNIVSFNRNVINNPTGENATYRTYDASQLLYSSPQFDSQGAYLNHRVTTLTPGDVVRTIGTQQYGDSGVQDFRGIFMSSNIAKNKRSNGLAAQYLSSTVQSLSNELLKPDNDLFELANRAASKVSEPQLYQDPFITSLRMNVPEFDSLGYVTYQSLSNFFPETNNNTLLIDNTASVGNVGAMQLGGAVRGVSASWTGSEMETVQATMLSQAVPSLMMDLMLTSIKFSATNKTLMGGQVSVTIHGYRTFVTDFDMETPLRLFVDRIQTEVLNDLSYGNQIPFELDMSIDILGDTFISLVLLSHRFDYQLPSFCDALMTPVIANSVLNLNQMAYGIKNIVDAVSNY